MHLIDLLSTTVTFLVVGRSLAEARVPSLRPAKAINTAAHDISLYTRQHFLGNAMYNELPCNSCLFYTFSLTATAQRYALGSKLELITIWDIWPSGFYNGDRDDKTNALRSIFNSTKDTRTYYENMSSAMAELCSGYATVMTKDVSNIPIGGIWSLSELPTLKRGGKRGESVHTVIAMDAKGENLKMVWEHPRPNIENCERKTTSLNRRQGVKRYQPEQLQEWFAEVPF